MCTIPFRHVPGARTTNIKKCSAEVTMNNMRGIEKTFSLDVHGFQVEEWPTNVALDVFSDNAAIEKTYYHECEEYLKTLGVKKVFIFDHVVSTRFKPVGVKEFQRNLPPALGAHVDQTPASARRRVLHHLPDEADKLLQGRVQILNLWRPLFSGVRDHPLALCDYRSTSELDLIAADLPSPHYEGEMFYVKPSVNHSWWFLDAMKHEEVLLLKCYDSKAEEGEGMGNIARFTPHTSFKWSGTPEGARPRESIEVRALCFY
ncbi:hypothetical protein K440DRAFT_607917 [Wilcoxina mikolae CBS 423.85]|nr:hypothetical protein K440DRAFT_607917 [Wilcoxina mikolae CBS 423.85]